VAVTVDYILVGGGLANGLVALALRARHPAARIVMIDRGPRPGGNHTWCFHAGDVGAEARWLDPIIAHRWSGYDVAFPTLKRRLDAPYACVTSETLAERVLLDVDYVCASATSVGAHAVVAGETFEGRVIDARGPEQGTPSACGWQKFLGQEIVTADAHGIERPMLMDATLPQTDGFRFMYVLPLARDRLLVEDTYFSDTAFLDVAALRTAIARYVELPYTVVREETGVLPLPWQMPAISVNEPMVIGYAGGWFHPVTGYSFPIAARVASEIARTGSLDELAAAHNKQLGFALRLNKMLFHWFKPEHRYHVLERFYRLPEPVIRRFYALELTAFDRARILIGRPPRGLSLRAALEAR
jgi:lycopene beta-cyclase